MSTSISHSQIQTIQTSRGGLRHLVVQSLLKEIFLQQLKPGTRLMVMKMAEQFGTSSTPCREALVELESVGVVEFIHNRGAAVAPFGAQELREIYQLRRVLEAEAAAQACGRINEETLSSLRDKLQKLKDTPYDENWGRVETDCDLRLHGLISAECGSRRLAKEIRRYDTLVQTIREIIGADSTAQQRALVEHLEIIDKMLAGDAAGTAAAMINHIESAALEAETAMFSVAE